MLPPEAPLPALQAPRALHGGPIPLCQLNDSAPPLTPRRALTLDPHVTPPLPTPQGYFTVNDPKTGNAVLVTHWRLTHADTFGRLLTAHLAQIAAAARAINPGDLGQFATDTDPLGLRRLNPSLLSTEPELDDDMFEAQAGALSLLV